jgi:hypothetical protein
MSSKKLLSPLVGESAVNIRKEKGMNELQRLMHTQTKLRLDVEAYRQALHALWELKAIPEDQQDDRWYHHFCLADTTATDKMVALGKVLSHSELRHISNEEWNKFQENQS